MSYLPIRILGAFLLSIALTLFMFLPLYPVLQFVMQVIGAFIIGGWIARFSLWIFKLS